MNSELQADLKKLKDELAINKQSEHCPQVSPGLQKEVWILCWWLPLLLCQSINNQLTHRSWVKTNKWHPACLAHA